MTLKAPITADDILAALASISGGYIYSGAASYQVCFPLSRGGELRFSVCDDDAPFSLEIDLYDGSLPGITGPTTPTGARKP